MSLAEPAVAEAAGCYDNEIIFCELQIPCTNHSVLESRTMQILPLRVVGQLSFLCHAFFFNEYCC